MHSSRIHLPFNRLWVSLGCQQNFLPPYRTEYHLGLNRVDFNRMYLLFCKSFSVGGTKNSIFVLDYSASFSFSATIRSCSAILSCSSFVSIFAFYLIARSNLRCKSIGYFCEIILIISKASLSLVFNSVAL